MIKALLILILFSICKIFFSQDFEKEIIKAEKLENKDKYTKAIKIYNKILLINNTNSLIFGKRGFCYFHVNKLDKSLSDLNYFLKIYPNSPSGNVYIGLIHGIEKRFVKSIEYIEKGISLGYQPNSMVHFYHGSSYYFTGKNKKAIKYLEKSFELDTNQSEIVNNLAWAYLDIDLEKSCKYFKLAYQKDSLSDNNVNNLGYAYLLNGELEKAFNYFEKAKQINPNNSFIYRNLGLYYKEKNEQKLACKYLQKAIDLKIIENWGKSYIAELENYCN